MSGYPASMRDALQRQSQASPAAASLVRSAAANRNGAAAQQQQQPLQPASHGTPQPFGRGNQVMGGLGVGPSGEAQQPLMSAQYSVSGTRGRRSDTLSAEQQMLPGGAMRPRRPQEQANRALMSSAAGQQQQQQQQQQQYGSIEQYQREMQLADQARRGAAQADGGDNGQSILSAPDGGRRMLLTYNSAAVSSMEIFNTIFSRSTQPHPLLFDWSVEIVDVNAPRLPPQSDAIVRQLRQMPQFQREIVETCVLFDRLKKVAYKEVQHICQVVQAQKDNIVAALVERQGATGGGGAGGAGSAGVPTGTGGGGEKRGLVREHHSVTQPGLSEKSIKTITRRSVLHGVNPDRLEDIAQHEERRIRRDPAGNNSSIRLRRGAGGGGAIDDDGGAGGGFAGEMGAAAGGVDMSGVGGTMFEGMGGAYNAAAVAYGARSGGGGGGDNEEGGFLPQISVKDLRR